MSKSYAATKRDLREFCDEHEYEEQWTADWKLTRHPYGKKKHKFGNGDYFNYHQFGSPKHMNRKSEQKDKQRVRQCDRTHRKNELKFIIDTYEYYE